MVAPTAIDVRGRSRNRKTKGTLCSADETATPPLTIAFLSSFLSDITRSEGERGREAREGCQIGNWYVACVCRVVRKKKKKKKDRGEIKEEKERILLVACSGVGFPLKS